LFSLFFWFGRHILSDMRTARRIGSLPPPLQDVCAILAAALVRLMRPTAENVADETEPSGEREDNSLHFTARQSGHAKPSKWDRA
jgi:hypothetical protein